MRKKIIALKHNANLLAQAVDINPRARHTVTVQTDFAAINLLKLIDAAQKCRFAAA